MLLVITNKADLACDYLILRLKEKNIAFTRLNTEDLGNAYEIDLSVSKGKADFKVSFHSGGTLTGDNVNAVYFRQPLLPDLSTDVVQSDREFAEREIREQFRSLWRLIGQDKWVNHPRSLWLASNKVEQLSLADRLGLQIPDTIVTCSSGLIREFFHTHQGRVVCKAVKNGFMQDANTASIALTQRLDEHFIENIQNFAPIPAIYQNEIPKDFDIRVIVIGHQVFATAIHSQEYPETEVDWRAWDECDFALKHEAIQLPKSLAKCCRDITSHFGLKYSAIDLVRSSDGRYYFLELNPNGQWVWIEHKTGYAIRDSIIHCMGYSDAAVC